MFCFFSVWFCLFVGVCFGLFGFFWVFFVCWVELVFFLAVVVIAGGADCWIGLVFCLFGGFGFGLLLLVFLDFFLLHFLLANSNHGSIQITLGYGALEQPQAFCGPCCCHTFPFKTLYRKPLRHILHLPPSQMALFSNYYPVSTFSAGCSPARVHCTIADQSCCEDVGSYRASQSSILLGQWPWWD